MYNRGPRYNLTFIKYIALDIFACYISIYEIYFIKN